MKHDLDYMIAVMQAAKEGKEIEAIYLSRCIDECDWVTSTKQLWDWDHYDYRIKVENQKTEYVPYESAEEFLQAQQEHGIYFTFKTNKLGEQEYYLPTSVSSNKSSTGVWNDGIRLTFESLLENYMWRDGTPCGKLKK